MTRIALAPRLVPELADAVQRAGAELAPAEEAEAIVWTSFWDIAELRALLLPQHRWVSLPVAGVDRWMHEAAIDDDRTWTCFKGVYAAGVAEHGVALLLAGAKRLAECARATTWESRPGRRLSGAVVAVIGAGGIGREMARLLLPFRVRMIGTTRRGSPVEGFHQIRPTSDLLSVLEEADYAVVAAPLTAETRHLIDARALDAIGPGGYLVNLARGALVDTGALVAALKEGRLGGAALDVTEPEPLPDGHPLWALPQVLITPHTANPAREIPWDAHVEEAVAHVERNVRAFLAGQPLEGVVDTHAGY